MESEIKLMIRLTPYIKVNQIKELKGLPIVGKTNSSTGNLYYINDLGMCFDKEKNVITVVNDAYVVLNFKNKTDLIKELKKYKLFNVWI